MVEVENMIGEIDDEVRKQMLRRYIEGKGLTNAEEFDLTNGKNESVELL